jgi:hypothetical protein
MARARAMLEDAAQGELDLGLAAVERRHPLAPAAAEKALFGSSSSSSTIGSIVSVMSLPSRQATLGVSGQTGTYTVGQTPIRKLVRALRPLRSATIAINGATQTFAPRIDDNLEPVLKSLRG